MEKDFKLIIDLPKSWAKGTISEVISANGVFVDGDWIESKDQDPNGEVRLIQLADIGDGFFRDRSSRFLTLKRANEIGCTFLKQGDILVARMPDPIGRSCIFPLPGENKFVTAVDVAIIRPGINSVNAKMLNFYINSPIIRNKIEALQSGTTRKRISRGNLALIEFPIPPLYEQDRIVLKLNELLSEIEKGKEQLQTSLEQLKVYRQSILKSAFEGKYTETGRTKKQYGETNELIKKLRALGKELKVKLKYPMIKSDEELPEIPNEWQWIRNEEMLKYVTSGSRDWKKFYSDSGSIFIRTQDIKTNNLTLENVAYVKLPTKAEGKRSLVELNDILMTITGANVGKVALIDKEIPEAYVSQSVALLKYLDSRLTKYMWYYFQSRAFGQGLISNLVYGVGRPVLSLENMKEVPVALCPIKEQQVIVNEIESRFSVCDKMEEEILQSLSQIESLKHGLLQKAFEGKLVEQDPNDELGTILLERIKKEREEYLKAVKERSKTEKPLRIKSKRMAEELKRIIEILKESKAPVSAKTLWQASTHKDDIDDFYAALKQHIEAGEIIELPRKGKDSFLKLAGV